MDRLKNSGFYKLNFFITPEEFKSMLGLLEPKEAQFFLTNHAQTEHAVEEVYASYQRFYQYSVADEKKDGIFPLFVYSISVFSDTEKAGFFMTKHEVYFPQYGQWAEDKLPSVSFSFPKGFAINLEDEKGKYYIYEDIRDHKPSAYELFHEVTGAIKKMTKPLRFSALDPEVMKEQKPAVRISPQAAEDLNNSWLARKYGLVIRSK
jgi:hypothetical protein